jgi:FAD-dependent urate hydroxylase
MVSATSQQGEMHMAGPMPDVDVAIVGSGPYGLSIAAHLAARGVDHRVFGRPMEAWQAHMPAGMYLKSEGFASSFSDPDGRATLRAHCADRGIEYGDYAVPVPLGTFVSYGLAFQERLVPNLESTEVLSVGTTPGGFRLRLATGEEVEARRVVLAVGVGHFAHVPPVLANLGPEFASHTSAHANLGAFKGQEVTVIGAGQSALETAALLHEHDAEVRVLVRAWSVDWNVDPEPLPRPLPRRLRRPMSGLGPGLRVWFYSKRPDLFQYLPQATRLHAVRTTLGPAGAWWLRERVLGRVPVLLGHTVRAARAEDGRVRLEMENVDGPIELTCDHVIAGTGYRVDLRRLAFLEPALLARIRHVGQAPVLSPSFESSLPGLYFVGLAAANHFGPVMRFVYGANFTARRLTAALAGTASSVGLKTTTP